MFRLAHISETYVLSPEGMHWREMLLNKRITLDTYVAMIDAARSHVYTASGRSSRRREWMRKWPGVMSL